jgi:hypothetical protein
MTTLPSFVGDADPVLVRVPGTDLRMRGTLWLLSGGDTQDEARAALHGVVSGGSPRRNDSFRSVLPLHLTFLLARVCPCEIVRPKQATKGKSMKHSDQGITKTQRGEEQPADKDRAQTAQKTGGAESSPSRQETSEERKTGATRSGQTTKSG